MAQNLGIIGYGNMGQVFVERIKPLGGQIFVFDKDKDKLKGLEGINVSRDSKSLASLVDTLVLAVKPQDIDGVLRDIKNYIKNKLVISIAAGISTHYIEKALGEIRVIRVMPNITAKIGESVSCLCKGAFATENDLDFAQQLFYYLGTTKVIDEGLMNAVTAITGSGPGYVFDFLNSNAINPDNVAEHTIHDLIKRLERAAEAVGFAREDAVFLAANTVNSSISLIKRVKLSASELVKQVASKGGTTEAALEILHKDGTWEEAALAALKRAEQLAKKG